jgi:hypothetical protein
MSDNISPVYHEPMMLKKARIEIGKLNIDTTGNAFTVRVLPDMDGIDEEQTTFLPRYGHFFLETARNYQYGDIVWVLCSTDYQVGYILGIADQVGGSPIATLITKINSAESQFGMELSDIRSADILTVNDQFIDFTNLKYGHIGRITNSGAISMFASDGSIYMSNKGVVIKFLSNGSIQQTSKTVEINAQTVTENSASHILKTQGYIEEISGSKKENIGVSLSQSIGGDAAKTVAGDENNITFKKKTETGGLGYTIQVILPLGSIDLNAFLGSINLNSIFLNAPLGFANPFAGPGPFCAIPFCLLTGVPHTGRKFTGVPLP